MTMTEQVPRDRAIRPGWLTEDREAPDVLGPQRGDS